MRPIWCLLLWLAIAPAARAQTLNRRNLEAILGFENNTRTGVFPLGWSGNQTDVFTDDQVFHSGKYSARIERNVSSPGTFTTLTVSIPLDFSARTIEWRGFLKWENVNGFVALWMRVDGDTPSLAFATLQGLNLNGTKDWTPYSISVPAVPAGRQVVFGFLLTGTGKGWVDDLQLLADGIPVAQAPARVSSVLDADHEFDLGSQVSITGLSNVQIKNLATLARVWGFIKYHHLAVTGGLRHWDYDLFRVLPAVLNAADSTASASAISTWVRSLGDIEPCAPCASLDSSNLYLAPNVDWIRDESLLGRDLSQTLQAAHQNRKPLTRQFYVSLSTAVSNPVFENELNYPSVRFPDAGYQLLALFRYWNIVQYFYPNRDIMSDDPAQSANYWDIVLEEFIPRLALAPDAVTYQQELMKFIAKINDTHANLWSSLAVRPPIGSCQLPVDVRFVEGRPLVLRHISPTAGPASGLLPGDVIEALDGVAVDDLIQQWRPIYADSNEPTRLRDIGNSLTRGPCGATAVAVKRGQTRLDLESNRVPASSLSFTATYTHDLPGSTFQMLTDDIAYLKLSSVRAADSANYVRAAAGTKGLIIDIRNYPSEFVVFALGQLLISEPRQFVRFTSGDITNPGAFHWGSPLTLIPQEPHYPGKVVILIDEVTQSQAEYTTMAFRTAPGAIVIGSTTAGADGNVSTVPLPGAFSSYVSGLGVFYPDKRPTQRVGILPDIEVLPTIEGIRAGRDELIEEAIRQIKPQPTPTIGFALKDQAAASLRSTGTSSNLSVGYGAIRSESGSTPSGLAIFGFRQNNVLVTEAGVPASPLIQNGRTYAEMNATVTTGLAIANPGNEPATISFYFTDSSGSFGTGTTMVAGRGQIAAFLNEAPFNGRSPMNGSFSFTSSVPVAVIALRGLTNSRGEFLITTLPVIDRNASADATSLVFAHFADGGGWSTQIVLANPTENAVAGTVQFRDPSGTPVAVQINNQTSNSFGYSVPARSAQKLQLSGAGQSVAVGSVRIVPAANSASPFGIVIFSFRSGGTIVSEAAVPAVTAANSFRLYAQASGDFKAGSIGSIQTGIAVTNTSSNTANVTLELFRLDGSAAGLKGTLSVPVNGQVATFLNQVPELASLQLPFQGTLRVSSSVPVSVVGLRGRYNERRDFLMTTMAPVNEAAPPSTAPLYFPHIADSGGYTTQFILFGRQESAGVLSLFDQSGSPMNLMLRQ